MAVEREEVLEEAVCVGFPPSARKQLIFWVTSAKRPETRARRVAETVARAARGERANQ